MYTDYLRNLTDNVECANQTALRLKNCDYGQLRRELIRSLQHLDGFQCIILYGSRMSGLANGESDLDIFVQFSEF